MLLAGRSPSPASMFVSLSLNIEQSGEMARGAEETVRTPREDTIAGRRDRPLRDQGRPRPARRAPSRAAPGAAAAPPCPVRLLVRCSPTPSSALAARLPDGVAIVSATNGKTTTSRDGRRHPRAGPRAVPQRRRREPRLRRGLDARSTRRPARGWGCWRSTSSPCRGRAAHRRRERSCSATCSATSSTATASSSSSPSAGARWWRGLPAVAAAWSSVPTTRPSATLGVDRPDRLTYGIDDPAVARAGVEDAADTTFCVRCGAPYDYAAVYLGHLGDYACPRCGHAPPRARPRRPRRAARRVAGSSLPPRRAGRQQRGAPARARASTTSRTRSARSRWRTRWARRRRSPRSGCAASGRRSAASSG